MNEYGSFIKKIGLVGFANILISFSGLIFIPIITKSFTTAEYGVWAQVNTTIALIPNIANLGLPFTMVRFLSAEKDKTKIRESFYPMLITTSISTIIICILFILFRNPISQYLFNGSMQILYITTALCFFACMNLMLISYFRTFRQMKKYSLFLVLKTYIGVFASIYLVFKGYSIETVVFGLLFGYVSVFIAMSILIFRYLGFESISWNNLREHLEFAIPTVPGNISSWVVDSSDKHVIGIIIGSGAVGCYSPGYALGTLLSMFLYPFSMLLPATLPEYYESGNLEEVDFLLTYSMKYFLVFTIPVAVGLSILSKTILITLTTTEIANGGYLITPIVCLGSIFFGMYGIISNILVLEKNTKLIGKLWIITAILNIILNLIMVPYYGIIGAGVSTLICYIIAFIVTIIASKKTMKIPFEVKSTIKIIISSLIMGIVLYLLNPIGLINIAISIIIGVIVYFVALLLTKGITKKEIKLFKEFIS